jgi:vacuolar-type H+-ATPase subunit H
MLESGLDQLIETERRLALLLAEAGEAADTIVAEARRAAREAAGGFEAELQAAERKLAERIRADQEAEIAAIRGRADRELARLRELPDHVVAGFAAALLDSVLAIRPEEAT